MCHYLIYHQLICINFQSNWSKLLSSIRFICLWESCSANILFLWILPAQSRFSDCAQCHLIFPPSWCSDMFLCQIFKCATVTCFVVRLTKYTPVYCALSYQLKQTDSIILYYFVKSFYLIFYKRQHYLVYPLFVHFSTRKYNNLIINDFDNDSFHHNKMNPKMIK